MTKEEVFKYISTTEDKSGVLKKESGFRIRFPEIYQEYLNTVFPESMKDLPFKQRIWHFLRDDYTIPICKVCGGPVRFSSEKKLWGYRTYCSGTCAMRDSENKVKLLNTKLERYGDKNYNNAKKQQETVKKVHGDDWWAQQHDKSSKTRREKNNGKYFSSETLQKIKDTNFERYGVIYYPKTQEYKEKCYNTKRSNNSFSTSKIEEEFTSWLDSNNILYKRQYRSKEYPFACDFYFPDKDLYFEINASWTHGQHLFNPDNPTDQQTLTEWKNKKSKYYNNAIETWAGRDIKKYNIAKENHLNWVAVYSNNLDDIIEEYDRH